MKSTRFLAFFLLLAMLSFAGCGDDDDDDDHGATDDDNDDASPGDDDDNDNDDNDDNDDTTPSDEVRVFTSGEFLVIRNSQVVVRYHLAGGWYELRDGASRLVVAHADARVYSFVILPLQTWKSTDLPHYQWTSEDVSDALGTGKAITVSRGGVADAPALRQTFAVYQNRSAVRADVSVINTAKAALQIGSIYALYADTPDGGLLFGMPHSLRVLTNGAADFLDFAVPLSPGSTPTISNWSTLVYNPEAAASFLLGYLTFNIAEPIVYTGPQKDQPGWLSLQAVSQYFPAKSVAAGAAFNAETMLVDFGAASPFAALETYADRLHDWLGISTWLERHPEIGVPAGWNSWSGSSSSGGYGHDIDEQIIVDNMDFAARELRRWGMNYFQIDDGWQQTVGDWVVNTTRFPDHGDQNGIEWLMNRAHDYGFLTGLWISAFIADENAQILQDHPDWFTGPFLFGLVENSPVLDFTNPEVEAYLTDLMETLQDWGIDWLKLDFAYRALMTSGWYEPDQAIFEFYRRGVSIIRQALADDVFFLNVALVGANYGQIDSDRITLDTMPVWEGENEDPYSPIAFFDNQGLKPMYRDCARRYYLHGRVWINHPDLIFFRAHSDPQFPPLTLNESQTFATSVALQGGIVKIGDRIVDLSTDAVRSLRGVLPVYGKAGRPIDLFRREFPEVWVLPVEDFDEPYTTVGLLNWGLNRDLTVAPYEFVADAERELVADFNEAGLDPDAEYLAFEYWTQEFLGVVTGELAVTVPARTPRVVALRPLLGRPQLLGTNRHVLGGAAVIRSLAWNEKALTLTGVQEGSVGTDYVPFEHVVTLYVPAGYAADSAAVEAPAGFAITGKSLATAGNVATLRFTVVDEGAAQWHPDVTWTVTFSATE
ncbi:MAG: hypothetical protein GX444_05670 [Myxococcales bacterium]|nr:hypothetical protein [Myxococcales bacterium]